MHFFYLVVAVILSLGRVQHFVTPWTVAHQAPLSSTISWSLLKFMSIESVMLSNHLILCCPLLLLLNLLLFFFHSKLWYSYSSLWLHVTLFTHFHCYVIFHSVGLSVYFLAPIDGHWVEFFFFLQL